MNLAPSAPSMTLWSYESASGRIAVGLKDSPFHVALICIRETPNIATSGEFIIGVNWVPPMPPRLEMVKPASFISSGFNNPSLALAEVSVSS